MNWKIVLVMTLLLIVVIFTAQNYEMVEIKFLFWTFASSRAIVLFLTLCIGVAVGWIISFVTRKE